uniref:Uncharacterized protein n=1 Tax=Eutreptiella gymnastica TaxID=73025 RepID=A0A6U7TSN3_9EUGL|mmetsp:Transcript_114169/g.198465  ORF Transcript_114169/g.198465 Transcript_114169/m.198465 type:complete len:110 (+) Transcript_114169:95-424(+)
MIEAAGRRPMIIQGGMIGPTQPCYRLIPPRMLLCLPGTTHSTLGPTNRVLGVVLRVLGVAPRVLGEVPRVLGVAQRVLREVPKVLQVKAVKAPQVPAPLKEIKSPTPIM